MASGFSGDVAIEPVLPHRTPSLPPLTAADARLLDTEITRSAVAWRGYMDGAVAV